MNVSKPLRSPWPTAFLVFATFAAVCGAENRDEVIYDAPVRVGILGDRQIPESSGLARCRSRPDCLWTHNDSSDTARLFLLSTAGETLATAVIDGAEACDWEDMCSFDLDGISYLLIGDIGDNQHRREHITLYLVREPDAKTARRSDPWRLRPQAVIRVRLEEGPRDCEALAVDASRRVILLATKSLGGGCLFYQLPLSLQTDATPVVAKVIGRSEVTLVTGMDVSDDGLRAMLVTYLAAYEFPREPREDWAAALKRPGRLLRMPDRAQGEAICYGSDGRTLFLSSEGKSQPLWMVPPRTASDGD